MKIDRLSLKSNKYVWLQKHSQARREGDFHSTPIFLQRIGEFVQIFRLKWKRKARTNELIYKNK